MCGVAGAIGLNAGRLEGAVRKMLLAMEHRGPDGDGIYISPSGTCVLGHRRLSILDLSAAAAQPMLSSDRRYALSYNGEIYNFQDLKRSLPLAGGGLRSSGDTEVLLRLLMAKGSQALDRLNGMFVLALWDEARQRLLLARDSFGQKPLYFSKIGGDLIFASEQKALLASGLLTRELDVRSSLSFLTYGWCPEPATMLTEVKSLLRGHFMVLEPELTSFEPASFFTPSVHKQACAPEELRGLFTEAVQRTLVSDAPLGLFLSGGIDSGALAAVSGRLKYGHLRSLTVVFPDYADKSEGPAAREVAELCGTEHTEIAVSAAEVLRMLPNALASMDQPSMDGLNTYLVAFGARQAGLKVALSGLGGDELFGGYPSFLDIPRMLQWRRRLGPLAPLLAGGLELAPMWDRFPGKLQGMLEASDNLQAQYLLRRQVFSRRQLSFLAPEAASRFSPPFFGPYRQGLLDSYTRQFEVPDAIGLLESDLYMGHILLRDSDVMGMAHSLEIRNPFLDLEFSQRVRAMDPETRIPGSVPKKDFVRAMGEWLPDVCKGPKRGFGLPFGQWMLTDLRPMVEHGLKGIGKRCPWIRQQAVDQLWVEFQRRPEKIGWARPWSIFVLGKYLETLEAVP